MDDVIKFFNMVTANYMIDRGQLTVPACDGCMTCDFRSLSFPAVLQVHCSCADWPIESALRFRLNLASCGA